MPKAKTKKPAREQPKTGNILPGFAPVVGPEGREYYVPEFMIPALHQDLAGYSRVLSEELGDFFQGNENSIGRPAVKLGEHRVPVPVDPGLTKRELLSLHTEVCALRDRLGISYKDAAHRLYSAECGKIAAADLAAKTTTHLANRCRDAVLDFERRLASPLGQMSEAPGAPAHPEAQKEDPVPQPHAKAIGDNVMEEDQRQHEEEGDHAADDMQL